jgi:hypothetical protein
MSKLMLMKSPTTILLFFLAISRLFSQFKHDYTWAFGISTDPVFPGGTIIFDFNHDSLHIINQDGDDDFFLTCSSISNADGQLLFSSNGCDVFDANFNTMLNGTGLNPGVAYISGSCPDIGNTVPKGLIILPLPGNATKYYIFHESLKSGQSGEFSLFVGNLYYSIVDMSLNNGLGRVTAKNLNVLSDTLFGDLHAVRHANGEDWWLLVSKEHKNLFFKVLFTANGISDILEQNIGIDPYRPQSGGGQAVFSPDGTMYARYYRKDGLLLYDFDRATGELSNFRQIYVDSVNTGFGGVSFSSNSRYIYVSTSSRLYQFDAQAADIEASKVFIDERDGYSFFGIVSTFHLMQLAPDCKIYMSSSNGSDILHVINNPDQPGLACNFEQHAIHLPGPGANASSMPNFPNYRLGTGYPVCDSNIVYVSGTGFVPPPAQGVRVWPNPASHQVTVALSAPLPAAAAWSLHDALGRELSRAVLPSGQQEVVVGLATVPPGLYFWNLDSGGRKMGSGKLVVTK